MIVHYLTIAFRNMWKYKNQTLISVIGLAVGFTCFALSTLWIRYETSFDSFHKNAKQMYVVYSPDQFNPSGYSRKTNYPLASYLKETFPEVANAMTLLPSRPSNVTVDDIEYPVKLIQADSSFFSMFDARILDGSIDYVVQGNKFAITNEKARQLFGNENPIGKTFQLWNNEYTICAVVSDMPKRSNYTFDLIRPFNTNLLNLNWFIYMGENTIIELLPGTDIEAFKKKLYEHDTGEERANINKLIIKPITELRYLDKDIEREVKFQHILIFAVSGLMVVLCSLFNYLTLFVSRFRIRQKELALRLVCGASGRSLLMMLTVEFILTLLFAVVLGSILTQLVHKPFLLLSDIKMNLPAIYRESLIYIGGVILVSLFVFWLILFIFRRRSLNLSIRRNNKNLYRKFSIVVQLIISVGFAFCTMVIVKQMYFLHHTNELGFSFQNRGSIVIRSAGYGEAFENHLKQIPEITEIVNTEGLDNMMPQSIRLSESISMWDDKPDNEERINLEIMLVSPEYNAFYDFRLLAGEMLTDADPESMVLLNESAVKAFGWHDPVGKKIDNRLTVKGVIKNVYHFAPTVEAKPICYVRPTQSGLLRVSAGNTTIILFKYRDGMGKSCKEKIEQIIKREYAEFSKYTTAVYDFEEEFGKFLKSESALIKLLSFVSAICILICVFGFVSLVSLTCEERRKEIAIRKINGATTNDILAIFAKEYFLLLMIGAAIAFSTSYLIMQRWLENYVKQTSIPAWVYLGIIFLLAFAIVLCVGWQVFRASVENPSEVVKRN